MRDPTDFDDKRKRKGDLAAAALFDDGQTILDPPSTLPYTPCRVRYVVPAPTPTLPPRTARAQDHQGAL